MKTRLLKRFRHKARRNVYVTLTEDGYYEIRWRKMILRFYYYWADDREYHLNPLISRKVNMDNIREVLADARKEAIEEMIWLLYLKRRRKELKKL